MTVYYEEEVDTGFDFDGAPKLAQQAAEAVLSCCELEDEFEVSVTVVDSDTIRELNRDHREIDSETDVLSFPMIDFTSPCDVSCITDDCLDPDDELYNLGDIILSADRIRSQAEDFGHSMKREFSFLIVHSMLHLLGYDHMEDDERVVMEDMQRIVMEHIGIGR
jgi:probable rRNA maturation factor